MLVVDGATDVPRGSLDRSGDRRPGGRRRRGHGDRRSDTPRLGLRPGVGSPTFAIVPPGPRTAADFRARPRLRRQWRLPPDQGQPRGDDPHGQPALLGGQARDRHDRAGQRPGWPQRGRGVRGRRPRLRAASSTATRRGSPTTRSSDRSSARSRRCRRSTTASTPGSRRSTTCAVRQAFAMAVDWRRIAPAGRRRTIRAAP